MPETSGKGELQMLNYIFDRRNFSQRCWFVSHIFPHLSDQDIFEKSMSSIPLLEDGVLRGEEDRILYVNGLFTPKLQLCKYTDWAEIRWLQEQGIKREQREGPEVGDV